MDEKISLFAEIPSYITPVLDTLGSAGYEAYLVGGCVRDAALGKVPNDYDITTSAHPEDMKRVFTGWRVIETGLKHGTLTVLSDGECVEVTTYRIDGEYADNRHPTEVSFTDDITLDLSRRDFTVNAMAYNPSLGLCDPFGGMAHLAERRIVCVGDAEARFREDGLRILRALRFASVLDFEIDKATTRAVFELRELLRGISKERVYVELSKLICGKGCARILRDFGDVLELCGDGVTGDDFRAAADVIGSLPKGDHVARLAYLCRISADRLGSDAKTHGTLYMRSLKTSTADVKRCALLANAMGEDFPKDEISVKRLMGRLTGDDILTYARLRGAYTENSDGEREFTEMYRTVAASDPCVSISQLAIGGNDVMTIAGIRGKEVGNTLSALLEDVILGRVENSFESLTRRLSEMKK